MGGEEFVVVLPGLDGTGSLQRWEWLRRAVADYPWQALTAGIPVTASIGATTYGDHRRTQSSLLRQADRNLYAAKGLGRNRVVSDELSAT